MKSVDVFNYKIFISIWFHEKRHGEWRGTRWRNGYAMRVGCFGYSSRLWCFFFFLCKVTPVYTAG